MTALTQRAFRQTTFRALMSLLGLLGLVLLATGCGKDSERPLPQPGSVAAADLPPADIVTQAQKTLTKVPSVRLKGNFSDGGKQVAVDLTVGDKKATGSVTTDGVKVNLIRTGDTIYLQGDDKFLQAIGPKAAAAKGKWLKAPIKSVDPQFDTLTDLDRYARQIEPEGQLVKEGTKDFAGQQAVVVRSANGARLYVTATGEVRPLRLERTGNAAGKTTGSLDFTDYGTPVNATAPPDAVDLASVQGQ